jgi:hypothetical protein
MKTVTCPVCFGEGYTDNAVDDGSGDTTVLCDLCHGEGRVPLAKLSERIDVALENERRRNPLRFQAIKLAARMMERQAERDAAPPSDTPRIKPGGSRMYE